MSIKSWWSEMMGKNETLTSALTGIAAFLAFCILAFVLVKVYQSIVPKAHADEVKVEWLKDASAYIYLDREVDPYSKFCYSGRNDDMTANLGFDTTLLKYGVFEWHAHLNHLSCSFGPDNPDYNAIGTGIVIRFTR